MFNRDRGAGKIRPAEAKAEPGIFIGYLRKSIIRGNDNEIGIAAETGYADRRADQIGFGIADRWRSDDQITINYHCGITVIAPYDPDIIHRSRRLGSPGGVVYPSEDQAFLGSGQAAAQIDIFLLPGRTEAIEAADLATAWFASRCRHHRGIHQEYFQLVVSAFSLAPPVEFQPELRPGEGETDVTAKMHDGSCRSIVAMGGSCIGADVNRGSTGIGGGGSLVPLVGLAAVHA